MFLDSLMSVTAPSEKTALIAQDFFPDGNQSGAGQ